MTALKRIRALTQAKRALEEAKLGRIMVGIRAAQSIETSALAAKHAEMAFLKTTSELNPTSSHWLDHERAQQRSRRSTLAQAHASQAEQTFLTARAVGTDEVIRVISERENDKARQSRLKKTAET